MPKMTTKSDLNMLYAVEKIFCDEYNVDVLTLHSKKRDERSARVRFMVWYILNSECYWSTVKIADAFNRDHSTVVSGVSRAKNLGLTHEARVKWQSRKNRVLSTEPSS